MPSFSPETIERWRAERVRRPYEGPQQFIDVVEEDLAEERRRLMEAERQVRISKEVIPLLEKKLDLCIKNRNPRSPRR